MCGGYRLEVDPEALSQAFGVDHTQLELPWSAELYPGQWAPVVLERRAHPTAERLRYLGALRWGLVPHWAEEPSVGRKLFNARVESAADKPSFRQAYARRRCVVPVNAFHEWTGEPGHKRQLAFTPPEGGLLAMAGLWEVWQPRGGDRLATFTVLTTEANAHVSPFHPRMPMLLAASHVGPWLAVGHAPGAELLRAMQTHTAQQSLRANERPR